MTIQQHSTVTSRIGMSNSFWRLLDFDTVMHKSIAYRILSKIQNSVRREKSQYTIQYKCTTTKEHQNKMHAHLLGIA